MNSCPGHSLSHAWGDVAAGSFNTCLPVCSTLLKRTPAINWNLFLPEFHLTSIDCVFYRIRIDVESIHSTPQGGYWWHPLQFVPGRQVLRFKAAAHSSQAAQISSMSSDWWSIYYMNHSEGCSSCATKNWLNKKKYLRLYHSLPFCDTLSYMQK